MSKILVTTDFSNNSKAGIRFAIQLASQSGIELVFYNVIQIMKPTQWDKSRWEKYMAIEIDNNQKKLKQFIHKIYKSKNLLEPVYTYVCEIELQADAQIISFAKKINADYICVGTKGAGNVKKLFGTNSSALIKKSTVPIIAVPENYRSKLIDIIWYASDLENLESEIKQVEKFTMPLKTSLNIIHYDYLLNTTENKKAKEELSSKYQSEERVFHFKKLMIEETLAEQIQLDVEKSKPSVLVLFTNQNRNWFERLLLSSKAAELTFDIKIPMLVFKK